MGFFLTWFGFSLILIPFAGFLILAGSLLDLFGVPRGEPSLDDIFMGIGEKR